MKTFVERFWEKVNKEGHFHPLLGFCWEWTASRTNKGYGAIRVEGKFKTAHRMALILQGIQLLPENLVLHHCDNPSCVRPDHLYVGTHSDNAQDREDRGRGKGCVIINRQKTHCKQGHPYEGKNLAFTREGKRKCQKCRVRYTTEYRRRKTLTKALSLP